MKFSWKLASVIAVLGLGIVGSLAVAAPIRGGWSWSGGSEDSPPVVKLRAPKEDLSDLAKELGVSEKTLRNAFAKVKDKLGPPKLLDKHKLPRPEELPVPPKPPQPDVIKKRLEKRCTEATDALGSELGKSGDEVRSAIKAVIKARIEKEVDAGRFSRELADKKLAGLDSAKCLLPFGPHVAFGCGPEKGPLGPGHLEEKLHVEPFPGRDELRAPAEEPFVAPAM